MKTIYILLRDGQLFSDVCYRSEDAAKIAISSLEKMFPPDKFTIKQLRLQ